MARTRKPRTQRPSRSARSLGLADLTTPKSDLAQTQEYNAKARGVLDFAGEADPTVKKPSTLERVFGILDAPGTAVRAGVNNLLSDDDVNIGQEVLKSLKGEDRIEGADIVGDLGVENKWGRMGLGFLLDVALDPLTYVSFGTGSAAKATGKGLIGRLVASGGIGADDLAKGLVKNLGDDAGRVASEIVSQFGDDFLDESGKLVAGKLSRGQSQKLMQDIYKALGDQGGVKLFGQSLGGQDALSSLGYKVKNVTQDSKLGNWLNQAFVRGKDADVYRLGNEAVNAGLDVAKRGLSGRLAQGERTAAELTQELKKLADDPVMRKEITVALGAKLDDPAVMGKLDDLYAGLAAAQDDAARAIAGDALDAFRSTLFDPNEIRTTLAGMGRTGKQLDDAVDVATRFRSTMDELLAAQRNAGVDIKDFPGYIPGVGELDTSKKAVAQTDEFLQGMGVDPAGLRDVQGTTNDFISKMIPQSSKAKEYATPTARLQGLAMGDDVAREGLRTELDVANLAGYATNKAEKNIALARFQDEVTGVLNGLGDDARAGAQEIVSRMEKVFTNDEAMKGFIKTYDKVLNYWKRAATIYNPGFAARNMLSNKYLMWTEDVLDPASEAESIRLLKGLADGTLDEVGERTVREAIEDGALTTARQLSEEVNPGRISSVGKSLGDVNQYVENQSRLSAYLTAVKKGGRDGAGAMVDKALYSYDPALLTSFERNFMRRIVPFYVWTRRNAPHMAELLVKNPGKLAPLGHLQESGQAVTDIDQSVMPDWLRDTLPVPTPLMQGGSNVVVPTAGLLPIAEIGDALDILKGGPTKLPANLTREVIGRMPPLLKLPLELAFNQDIYFQDEITRFPGETRRAPGYIEQFADLVENVPLLGDVWSILITSVGGEEKEDSLTGEPYLALPAAGVKVLKDSVPWMNSVGKLLSDAPRQKNDLIKAITGISSVQYDEPRFAQQQTYDDEQALRDQLRSLGLTTSGR